MDLPHKFKCHLTIQRHIYSKLQLVPDSAGRAEQRKAIKLETGVLALSRSMHFVV
jgi:hypothetical protein